MNKKQLLLTAWALIYILPEFDSIINSKNMEPILNHPELTYLLSIWKFLTAHHQYLQLPEQVSDISLYELDEHVSIENYQTSFMQELIKALTQKTQGYQAKRKNKAGLFFMAKFNKYKIFDDLVKDSGYELALSQVNFSLQRKNQPIIPTLTSFEKLTLKEKYRFLSVLTDLVSNSHKFKREYMENLKKDYSEALQKEGASKKTLNKDYQVKINSGYIMGTDSRHNIYYYIAKISDTIFSFNYRSGKWSKIQGVEAVRQQILAPLTKNGTIETVAQCDLCQSVMDVWKNLESPSQSYAFDKDNVIFSTKQKANLPDKMKIIKNLFHEFESEYTKYVSDCWNCRWASKQKRRKLLNDVDLAHNMKDLVICFSDFFNATKHSTHRKIKNFEFYDTNLKTDDVPQSQFKPVFLRVNYLYGKGVFSQNPESGGYPINLFNHIKSFIQEPEKYEAFIFQYLRIFFLSMIGVVKEIYPTHYEKRLKQMQNESKKSKDSEEPSKHKLKKYRNNNQRLIDLDLSDDEENNNEQSESQTTIQKQNIQNLDTRGSRRLRQKCKINYNLIYTDSSLKNLKKKEPSKKPIVAPRRKQPQRNLKGKHSKKMILESDSQESFSESQESETEQRSGGMNLDNYKYISDDETNGNRKLLRSSSKRR